jgi:hypothetical protein
MTPMQDLREFIVSLVNHGASDDLLAVIIAIDKRFLQKEEEQIMDAYQSGHSDRSFEKYNPYFYEENYNQNK